MSRRMGSQEPTRPLGPHDPRQVPTRPLGPHDPRAETSRLGGPPWPPQERQRPSWGRIGLALLVVALLVLTVMGLGGLARWRLWPSFPNPFATRSLDRSPPVVLKAIEDLHVYKAASGNFQVLIDLEKDSKYLPSFLKGERTLFVAAGSVDAEADFSGLAAAWALQEGAPSRSCSRRASGWAGASTRPGSPTAPSSSWALSSSSGSTGRWPAPPPASASALRLPA